MILIHKNHLPFAHLVFDETRLEIHFESLQFIPQFNSCVGCVVLHHYSIGMHPEITDLHIITGFVANGGGYFKFTLEV